VPLNSISSFRGTGKAPIDRYGFPPQASGTASGEGVHAVDYSTGEGYDLQRVWGVAEDL
jgi:hypothetical protein